MKVVDVKTFMELPVGTLVSRWDPCILGEPFIKHESIRGADFFFQSILNVSGVDLDNRGEKTIESNSLYREGGVKDNELFVVWSDDDIKILINTLSKAREINKVMYHKLSVLTYSDNGGPVYTFDNGGSCGHS